MTYLYECLKTAAGTGVRIYYYLSTTVRKVKWTNTDG